MANHKYNVISEEEILPVSDNTSQEVIQLPEEITLNSNYRQIWCGAKIPGTLGQTAQIRPVTGRSSQAKTTASTPKQVLLAPAQVASHTVASDDKKKKHK